VKTRCPALAVVVVALAAAAPAEDKLDKAAERWLKDVHLLILPDEEALYRELKDASDRKEFETIFWARRDPDPATPANELQEAVAKARTRADALFAVQGRKGSDTGCGEVLALLGEPQEVEGREIKEQFQSLPLMREGARRPEVWIYKSRPGDRVQFTGGELRLSFDEECRLSEGGKALNDLQRAAESRVVRPEIAYRKGADGHLVKLADLVRKASPGRTLLEAPRSDFPLTLEPKLVLRTQSGDAYVAGLLRAEVGGVAGGTDAAEPVAATVVAQAVDEGGRASPVVERPVRARVGAGGLVASYAVTLKPGRYTLRVALLAGEKGAVATAPLEVPDFDAPGLKVLSLLVYPEARDAGAADPQGPYGAFSIGALRLQPRFGNVFSQADALQAVCLLLGGQPDAVTGNPSLRARFTFLKDGKPVAKGEDQVFETKMAAPAVGPISLAGYAPGRYVVRIEVTDVVAQKTETRDAGFEIAE
jgi:GWxTD domain-containing protein